MNDYFVKYCELDHTSYLDNSTSLKNNVTYEDDLTSSDIDILHNFGRVRYSGLQFKNSLLRSIPNGTYDVDLGL